MNTKVCGITQLKQLQQLDGLDIDFAGLIFYKDSPRYVGDKIKKEDLKNSDFDLKKVGVFVNAGYDEIMQVVEDYGLDVVQLHGDESPDLCEELSEDVEVIKAFKVKDSKVSIDEMVADYDEVCDYYLFDTASSDVEGGSGKQFDWKLLSKSKIEKPFFLSGGIGVDDVAKLKTFKHPDYYAVDINSKVEKEPGVKDMALVLQFRQGLK
ncbi:MAG: phosphoribosylanthranilate isomerase [Chitinophagaceae bacterium]|nr:phosphoribosylanthranilate isomerase [Chitinophagaceae bacterium]